MFNLTNWNLKSTLSIGKALAAILLPFIIAFVLVLIVIVLLIVLSSGSR